MLAVLNMRYLTGENGRGREGYGDVGKLISSCILAGNSRLEVLRTRDWRRASAAGSRQTEKVEAMFDA